MKTVALYDVDSRIPNLALMKLSAWPGTLTGRFLIGFLVSFLISASVNAAIRHPPGFVFKKNLSYWMTVFRGPLARMTREALDYIRRNYVSETVIKHPDRAEATRVENFPYAAIEEAVATYFMCRLPVHPQAKQPEAGTPQVGEQVGEQVVSKS